MAWPGINTCRAERACLPCPLDVFPRLKPISATAKEMIFNRGDRSRDLFFLLKGEIWVRSPHNTNETLNTLLPGDYFGGVGADGEAA